MKAREYALNCLERVVMKGGYANLVLRQQPQGLSAEDRALASELVYGTLRNLAFLEYQWHEFARRKVQGRLGLLLDMSVYQMLFLDRIPDYAAVSEAVDLSAAHEKAFVNAVLHKVMAQGMREVNDPDPLVQASIRLSHPLWLLRLWASHYGTDNALAIARHDQTSGRVYGRINTLKTTREAFSRYPGVQFLDETAFTFDGVIAAQNWFERGEAVVQDRASQQAVKMLDPRPGMNVLDCCAAPGTKTAQIAMMMDNQGGITALELHENRRLLLEQAMQHLGASCVRTACMDAGRADEQLPAASFDRILADAPCSGLGDLRHKPEIALRVKPDDLDAIVKLQERILDACARLLKPGGVLVYSTCTLNRKENENQAAAFVKRHAGFTLEQEKTWLPQELDSDGFYAAKIVKNL